MFPRWVLNGDGGFREVLGTNLEWTNWRKLLQSFLRPSKLPHGHVCVLQTFARGPVSERIYVMNTCTNWSSESLQLLSNKMYLHWCCFVMCFFWASLIFFKTFNSRQKMRKSYHSHHDNMSVQWTPPYLPLLYSKSVVYRGMYFI